MASFYNHYYNYYRPYFSNSMKNIQKKTSHKKIENVENEDRNSYIDSNETSNNYKKDNTSSAFRSFGPINFKSPIFGDIEEPVFEILGINFYLDDIIILGLLFLLYKEGVQDELLYITLIMLLLS